MAFIVIFNLTHSVLFPVASKDVASETEVRLIDHDPGIDMVKRLHLTSAIHMHGYQID